MVTSDAALLYTDGRYFLQAELELDCNWELMKVTGKILFQVGLKYTVKIVSWSHIKDMSWQ